MNQKTLAAFALIAGLFLLIGAVGYFIFVSKPELTSEPTEPAPNTAKQSLDKFSLWNDGTQLRGANVYQRKVYPELDGSSMGSDPFGPPLTQVDFNNLSKAGANLVVLSHPGLFDEKPPYALNKGAEANLDRLIGMAEKADLFVVVAFRTGPGRSEFAILREGDWFDKSYINDDIWKDTSAQDAYVAMWRYTADRFRNRAIVVGYELMVEPNSDNVLGIYDPKGFYPTYENSTYDWNQLHKRITKAIRDADNDTPILTSGMGYSSVRWLPYLMPTGDNRTVYTVHQYEPQSEYTHRCEDMKQSCRLTNTYPGRFDISGNGSVEDFNSAWLDGYLSPIKAFKSKNNAPVAVTEYGVMRWEPGADQFIDDEMELFEKYNMSYAIWEWSPSYKTDDVYPFNFRLGSGPAGKADTKSKLFDVVEKYWRENVARPSVPTRTHAPTVTPQPTPVPMTTPTPVPVASQSTQLAGVLKTLAEQHGIRFGAFYQYDLSRGDDRYDQVFEREMNVMTVGAFWNVIHHGVRTDFDFSEIDAAVAWAHAHGMALQAQSLVWFESADIPDWLRTAPTSEVESIMNEHIDTVVGRYAGRINYWNVVNEAVNDDGTLRQDNVWAQAMGTSYIDKAFIRAHAADPAAVLYYNDYNLESNQAKYEGIKALLVSLKNQGVPVHALGWQLHVRPGSFDAATLLARMNEIADLGFDNYITELDVDLPANATAADYEQQKQTYKAIVETFLAARRHKSIVVWGLRDGDPYWLTNGHPLLFDENFNKKPAYFGVQEALR